MGKENYIKLFRIVAILEGLSFVVLLFFAMPMKYYYNEPVYVKTIGMAHGLLFISFLLLSFYGYQILKNRIGGRPLILLIISSVLPFGTIVADYRFFRKS